MGAILAGALTWTSYGAVPTPEEYAAVVRRVSKLVASRLKWRAVVTWYKAQIVVRLAWVNVLASFQDWNLHAVLSACSGTIPAGNVEHQLGQVLEKLHLVAEKTVGLRKTVATSGFEGPITVWLLERQLAIFGDMIETLELSLNSEVREYLAHEIQQIAGQQDAKIQQPTQQP